MLPEVVPVPNTEGFLPPSHYEERLDRFVDFSSLMEHAAGASRYCRRIMADVASVCISLSALYFW